MSAISPATAIRTSLSHPARGSFAGIEVYLSEYNPKTGAFEGFSDPLFSPVPALTSYGSYYSSYSILKLVAGDFTGNGTIQLAADIVAPVLGFKGTTITAYLMFFTPETDSTHPAGTGYFYANTNSILAPYVAGSFSPNDVYLATALQTFTPTPIGSATSNGADVIVETTFGATSANNGGFSYASQCDVNGIPARPGRLPEASS